jgi:ribosomal protein S12 methylthiotransferase accessory factor
MTTDRGVLLAETFAEDGTEARKRYTRGTHRTCAPEDTVARLQPLLAHLGITRIANVTGLDRVGIPVVMVVRPNARSFTVTQGKGLTLAAAKASGLMEAAELWHAEHIMKPLKLASYDEMRRAHRVADPDRLPRAGDIFEPSLSILWIEGRDLMRGGPVWVPFELVNANFTVPVPPGSDCFQATTNGLASGNHPLEAIVHGLCEVVERDANTLWRRSGEARDRRAIDPSSVDDPECRQLLDQLTAADLAVRIWNTTSDVGVASFCCLVAERSGEFADPEYGNGCHPAREVALLRALTEAAQARVSYISGARDDFHVNAWEPDYRRRRLDILGGDLDTARPASASFAGVPSFTAPALAGDINWLFERLRAVGIDQVIAVDLGQEAVGLPVMSIVVPGLEGPDEEESGYTPGPRAQRLMGGPP